MTPMFFGTGAHRLFGMYAPAHAGHAQRRAVVLCPAWGDEYLSAHRAMRQLAHQLAAAGVDVLRFDYFGTGDSAGDLREASLAGWQDDIERAIGELRDTAGAERVGVVGLRLGATLAASLVARKPGIVDSLGLWDPVSSGQAYLHELERIASQTSGAPAEGVRAPDGTLEIDGFALTPALAAEIGAIELRSLVPKLALPVRVVVSASEEASRAARDMVAQADATVDFVPSPPIWMNDANFRPGAVPVDVLRQITAWFP